MAQTQTAPKFKNINIEVGDLVALRAGRTRPNTGRVVRTTGANVVIDGLGGYVNRGNVVQVLERPAHVNPTMLELFRSVTNTPMIFDLEDYDAQEPVETGLIDPFAPAADELAGLAVMAEIEEGRSLQAD